MSDDQLVEVPRKQLFERSPCELSIRERQPVLVQFPDKWTFVLAKWAPSSSGTENSAKAFSFLNTRSDFLTVAAVAALLATPSAALGDSVSSASVAALQIFARDELDRGSNSIKRRSYGPQGMTEPGRDRWLRCLITHHPDPFPSPYPTRLSLPTLSVLISVNHIFPSGPRMMRCIIVFSLGTG